MPATPSRIGFVQSEFRRVIANTSSVTTRHGALARESEDPIETFFDSEADAQVVANERQTLFAPERRRFRVNVNSIEEVQALTYIGAVPNAHYVDSERLADRKVIVCDMAFDFDKQQSVTNVWG